jgi:hypothetical protein
MPRNPPVGAKIRSAGDAVTGIDDEEKAKKTTF